MKKTKSIKYKVYIISAMNSSIYEVEDECIAPNESDRYYYHILARSDLEAEKIFKKITTNQMIEDIDEREPWGKFIEEARQKEEENGNK